MTKKLRPVLISFLFFYFEGSDPTDMLDYLVMQMRNVNHAKGYNMTQVHGTIHEDMPCCLATYNVCFGSSNVVIKMVCCEVYMK